MPRNHKVFVEAEAGPVMRTALDVLECALNVVVLLPEWHETEKQELMSRMQGLHEISMRTLQTAPVRQEH